MISFFISKKLEKMKVGDMNAGTDGQPKAELPLTKDEPN